MDNKSQKNIFYEHVKDSGKHIVFMHNTDDVGFVSRRHFHSTVEIGFMINGCAGYIVNDNIEYIQSGEMSYIDSWNTHYFDIHKGNETFTLILGTDYLHSFYHYYGKTDMVPYFDQSLRNVNANKEILEILYQWEKVYDPNDLLTNFGFVDLLLAKLVANYPIRYRKKNDVHDYYCLDKIIEYVNNNYMNDFTLDNVAKDLGYGMHYCSRVFHRCIDQDFRNYVNGVRIEMASRIMRENPSKRKEDVAYECGFKSLKTFYRAYKRIYGIDL